GDWQWRYAPEHSELLSSPGTELTTTNIIEPVHEQLLDSESVIGELQERWFRLISQGATIEYLLIKDGHQTRHVIREPAMPELDLSQGSDKSQREDAKVVITHLGNRLGELRNLHLYLAKKPFPEGDSRWGIAIVKNGKQTISRF